VAVKIVSDIHGEYRALANQLRPDDTAVMLGDYLNLIDFRTLEGILSEVYTREQVFMALIEFAKGRKEIARRSIREIAGGTSEQSRRVRELVAQGYQEFFASLPCRCYVLFGNTDDPALMRKLAEGDVEIVDSGVVTIEGERFGLVSGTPHGPWTVGLPGEMDPADYSKLVDSLGPCDVLCTHCPPAIPELTWDRLANRDEMGSTALLDYLDEYQPRKHYFGHVHNPVTREAYRGRTMVINAGFFKEHQTVLVHEQE
jgi:Icc-related predicted phosphoesterase